MEKKNQWNTGYWIVALLLLLSLQSYWQTAKTVEPVPHSGVETAQEEGRVAEGGVAERSEKGGGKKRETPQARGSERRS